MGFKTAGYQSQFKLPTKRYARIYVLNRCQIPEVLKIIKAIDEYEYEYMPKDLVAHYSEYPKVVYTHKFNDLDMNQLQAICWKRGIPIWVFSTTYETDDWLIVDATEPEDPVKESENCNEQ